MSADAESAPRYTLKQRIIARFLPPLAAFFLKLILLTCRYEVRNSESAREAERRGILLIGFWHESIPLALFHFRNSGFYTLTSLSFDGELAARASEAFGLGAFRGSSSRGGLRALEDMLAARDRLRGLGLTLDGPRGPRRESKPGMAMLSSRTQYTMHPFAIAISKCWRMRSWDRLIIPKPFARVLCEWGEPIEPPAPGDTRAMRAKTKELQDALNRLTTALEEELGVETYQPPTAAPAD